MSKNIRHWVYGAIAAFVGSAGSGLSAIAIDPAKFNLDSGFTNTLKMCLVSGVISLGAYLKQHPAPAEEAVRVIEPPAPPSGS